jgi:putative phosphoribosyl transferase
MLFTDRNDAGQKLAAALERYAHCPNLLVLGLPRGGVPVAYEVARSLGAPLDVFLVRKLGVPGNEELALGAIASGGIRVLNKRVIDSFRIPLRQIESIDAAERMEMNRREKAYRDDRPPIDLKGRTVILVDDGLATGSTMKAAVAAIRSRGPAHIVVAVPVAPRPTADDIRERVDDFVCVDAPERFYAVGQWYIDFREVTDEQVRELMARAESFTAPGRSAPVNLSAGA